MARSPVRSSRRDFLKRTAGASAGAALFPMIVPGRALGLDGAAAPSNRITLGFIGIGKMAKGHLGSFLNDATTQVLAICDVERTRREAQAKLADEHYAKKHGEGRYAAVAHCNDFRELCARPDIDAVVIATPNQWHAIPAIEAARHGKDIYLEKPMAETVHESKAIAQAVRRYGRVLQIGSQQRSDNAFRFACELVRNGRIGKVEEVFVNVGSPPQEDYLAADPAPEGLDWDFWLGPCQYRPYSAELAPPETFGGWPNWRNYRPYAGGGMTDFGAHHYDIAQWGLGTDHTGPVEIIPPASGEKSGLVYVYANGVRMHHGGGKAGCAVEFVGTQGRVRVNRGQYLETDPPELKREVIGPSEIHLYDSRNHKDNWLEAIRTRREPICPPEIGHRTATICNIGNIAYQLARPLKWDPVREEFVGDIEANRLLQRPMRSPWVLNVV